MVGTGTHSDLMAGNPTYREIVLSQLTEQEAVIEDLNAAITAQWAVIDRLKRGLARLQEQVEEAAFRAPGAPEPPPPHY